MAERKYTILHPEAEEYSCLVLDLCEGEFLSRGEEVIDLANRHITTSLVGMTDAELSLLKGRREVGSGSVERWMDCFFVGRLFYRIPVINLVAQESPDGKPPLLARKGKDNELVTIANVAEIEFIGRNYTGTVRNDVFAMGANYGTPEKLRVAVKDFFGNPCD